MSEDFGYGDCRDSCIQYAIESEYACTRCAEAEQFETEEDENYDGHLYDQG